ncbi:MAG: peptide chain release factor N(5)-glutamine methyltransferase [Candidatus Berkelbacteria bacterium]
MKSKTICTILHCTRELFSTNNIESADLDAQIIIAHVLDKDRVFLFSHPNTPVSKEECLEIDSLAKRRVSGEPVAYLTGKKEFYGYDFFVNKNVLVPRPETEHLVERGLEFLKFRNSKIAKSQNVVLDLGTGSGCIAISLALELTKKSSLKCEFYATDINSEALKIAKKNAKAYETDVNFLESDLFSNPLLPDEFDLILTNLPYVPHNVKEEENLKFEPKNAIFAKDNGSSIINEFLIQAKSRLNNDGLIIIELDPRNAKQIESFARETYQRKKIELIKDYAGHDRYLEIK